MVVLLCCNSTLLSLCFHASTQAFKGILTISHILSDPRSALCRFFFKNPQSTIYIRNNYKTASEDCLDIRITYTVKPRKFELRFFKLVAKGYSRKKYLGGEDGRRYIFLWVVGAESFQIIWVVGVESFQIIWVVGVRQNLITWVVG